MTLVTLATLIASIILALTLTVAIHVSIVLSLVTIIIPLYCSLYYYKGKWATLFLALSCIAITLALTYAVDMSATLNTLRNICDRLYDDSTIYRDAESIRCTSSLNEGGITTSALSSSFARVVFFAVCTYHLFEYCEHICGFSVITRAMDTEALSLQKFCFHVWSRWSLIKTLTWKVGFLVAHKNLFLIASEQSEQQTTQNYR